jgi:uncharacterized membrane protein
LALGTIFFLFDLAMLAVGLWELNRLGKTQNLDTMGPIPMGWGNWNAIRIATLAIMMALCVVAAMIPIPSPSGTIALDLSPAYFMALYAGPINGLIIAIFGHMAVALRAGFPLTVPVHIGIGIAAAGVGSALWYFNRKLFPSRPDLSLIIAIIIAILGNTFGTNILLSYIFIGVAMAIGTVPPIFIGSSANVIIGSIVWRAVKAYRGAFGGVRV